MTNGTVVVAVVHYRVPLWPFRQTEAAIVTLEGDEYSEGHWVHQGKPLDEAQADALRAQGHEVEDLSETHNAWK
jgi:hypothetical protein